VAIPGRAAPPAWLGWMFRLLGGHRIHEDGLHVAACGQLVEPLHRQQRPLPAALPRLDDLDGHILVAVGELPQLLPKHIQGKESLVFGGCRARPAWRTAPQLLDRHRSASLGQARPEQGTGPLLGSEPPPEATTSLLPTPARPLCQSTLAPRVGGKTTCFLQDMSRHRLDRPTPPLQHQPTQVALTTGTLILAQ
jgi:hypothetical protein